jgi:hypothetical protein
MGFLLFLLFWISGMCVQYVRVHTTHKDWLEQRKEIADDIEQPLFLPYMAIALSWFAFLAMTIKRFLDKTFINKK